MTTYTATRCPCGHRGCSSWHVEPVAAVQGVSFTYEQARAVASLLNQMEKTSSDPLLADAEALVRKIYADEEALPEETVRSVAKKIVSGLPRSVREKNQR